MCWGKIVEREGFYADTGTILAFDEKLNELGIKPVPKSAETA